MCNIYCKCLIYTVHVSKHVGIDICVWHIYIYKAINQVSCICCGSELLLLLVLFIFLYIEVQPEWAYEKLPSRIKIIYIIRTHETWQNNLSKNNTTEIEIHLVAAHTPVAISAQTAYNIKYEYKNRSLASKPPV